MSADPSTGVSTLGPGLTRKVTGSRWAQAAAIVLVVAGCAALGALISLVPPVPPAVKLLVAFGLAVLVALGPIALTMRGRALENPVAYYAAISFVYFIGASLVWLGAPQGNLAFLNQDDIANALLVVSLALAAVWCGYALVTALARPAARKGLPQASTLPPRHLVVAVAVIGLLARGIQIASGSFGYLTNTQAESIAPGPLDQVVATIGFGVELAVVMAAIRVFGTSDRSRQSFDLWLLTALVVAEVTVGFLSGFKGFIIPALIPGLIVLGRYRRRVPRKAVLAVCLFLVAFIPLNLNYRDLAQQGGNARPATSLALTTLTEAPGQVGSFPAMLVEWASERLRQIDNIAVIVRDTPSPRPSPPGRELITDPILNLVPRALVPDKPLLDKGREFAQVYFGQPSSIRSSIGATQIGDLYRRFLLPGVVLGMFAIGVVLALLARGIQAADPARLIVLAFLSEILVRVAGDLVTITATGVRLMLVVLVVGFLVRRHGASAAPGSQVPATAG
jgi:hypothetical protein